MGWRFRQSINLGGGFRVNISKTGVGYSWGVPGYRITKTASGRIRRTYSIPGTGLSYVDEESKTSSIQKNRREKNEEDSFPDFRKEYGDTVKDITTFKKSDSSEFVKNYKKAYNIRVILITLFILFFFSMLIVTALFDWPFWAFLLLFVASTVAYFLLRTAKGQLSVEYELDEEMKAKYDRLIDAWKSSLKSRRIMQGNLIGRIQANKNNFNANGVIDPIIIPRHLFNPKTAYIKSNIDFVILPIVNKSKSKIGHMVLLPDRILVKNRGNFFSVPNSDVVTELIEQPIVVNTKDLTKDTVVKGYRFLHSNADGTADKRYKDNPSNPIVHYARIDIKQGSSTYASFLFSDLNTIISLEEKLKIEHVI